MPISESENLRIDSPVKSRPMTLCHSEQSGESNHINVCQILHFVQDDKLGFFTNSSKIKILFLIPQSAFYIPH
jgi:hypothetical protein